MSQVKLASGINGVPVTPHADHFGSSVASLGDLDGDGVTELVVGAHSHDRDHSHRGAVNLLRLNADGTVKSSLTLESGINGVPVLASSQYFGRSVASLGDLNGDGVTELAVGAIGDDAVRGAVHVLFLKPLPIDFGDAPLPYPTTILENGARHQPLGPKLGANRDSEADGVHSLAANADDTTGSNDEDGVTFGTMRVGALGATATVNVQNAPSGAKLDAWIDFNGDGLWGGPGEQIADSVAVVNGSNTLNFDVTGDALFGTTFARFRLSTAGNLEIGGSTADGEVEDYSVGIASNDITAPLPVSFARQAPLAGRTNADTLVFRATFSEDVSGVSATDFVVSGGSTALVRRVTRVSKSVYDVTLSGGDLASFNGTVGLSLAAAVTITDLAGNALPNSEPGIDQTILLDNAVPLVDIIDVSPDPRTTRVGTVNIEFTEPVTGVDVADFSLTRDRVPVSLAGLAVSGSGRRYSLDLSTVTNAVGSYVLKLNSGRSGIQDFAGNGVPVMAREDWTRITPTVSVSIDVSEMFEFQSAVVTATLSRISDVPVTVPLLWAAFNDFSVSAPAIVIPAGSLTGTLTLSGTRDNLDELTETATARIGSIVNAVLGPQGPLTVSIQDDNQPNVWVSVDGGDLTIRSRNELPADVCLVRDAATQEFVVEMWTEGVVATEYRFAASSVTREILAYFGPANDRFDASAISLPTQIHGGDGDDLMIGSAGKDRAYGDEGNDTLVLGIGDDLGSGGPGNDVVSLGEGDDTGHGHEGNDVLRGGSGADTFDNDIADTRVTDGSDAVIANVFAGLPSWLDAR